MNRELSKSNDCRVRRTKQRLCEAFLALVSERGYAQVTIREVVHRAGVGRSTFYTHFGSLDDLHGSVLRDFLERLGRGKPGFSFARPFLQHVRGSGHIWLGGPGSRAGMRRREQFRRLLIRALQHKLKNPIKTGHSDLTEAGTRAAGAACAEILIWAADAASVPHTDELEAALWSVADGFRGDRPSVPARMRP